ncbi:MAG: HD-GYP domain-containing protein [Planctomycetaceae bacterium]|nr:HD-GYP domain-containing protein [Planctomycetaceae bacterium]
MSSLSKHVRAMATVLHEEFLVPFRIYDAATATQLWPVEERRGDSQFLTDNVGKYASLVGSRKIQVNLLSSGKFQLRLPFIIAGGTLIAEAVMSRIAGSSDDATKEQWRLERWGQAVLDGLLQVELMRSQRSAEDDLKRQLKHAWELNLTIERLIRHIRIHRDVGASVGKILEAAPRFVGAGCLAWVPGNLDAIKVRGEMFLADDDLRDLTKALRHEPALRESGLLLCPNVSESKWGVDFPQLSSVMVMTVPSRNSFGWVIAVRARSEAAVVGFRTSDAASLAPFAALIGLINKASERYQETKDVLVGLTRSLASAVDAKDPYTYGHSERVARIAVELGRELHLADDELSDVYLAGLLHDIGKIGIRDDVLCKHGPLTPEETQHMQQHPEIGHAILKDLHQISSLLPGVLHHHERYDGAGYPAKLAGEQIPRIARILAVADSYDAMSTSRPYRQGLAPDRVDATLIAGSGQQWDPRIIEVFQRIVPRLRSIREHGLGESLRQALDGALRDTGSSRNVPANLVVPTATV